jgi:hypothetical protein
MLEAMSLDWLLQRQGSADCVDPGLFIPSAMED